MSILFPRLIARAVFCLGGSNVCSKLTACDCHAMTNQVCEHEKLCICLPARFLASHIVTGNK